MQKRPIKVKNSLPSKTKEKSTDIRRQRGGIKLVKGGLETFFKKYFQAILKWRDNKN